MKTKTTNSTPRRILIMNSCRKWIGEAAHSLDLYRHLVSRGHRVVLGCRAGYALEKAALDNGIAPLSLRFSSRFSPIGDLRDLLAVRRVLRNERIEIIHCHRGKDHWLGAVAKALFAPKIMLARTRHVVTPAKNHILNRWLYSNATDRLLSVSQQALEGMGALLDSMPKKHTHVILSAVDLERFCPQRRDQALRDSLGIGPERLLVGLIGRLQNIKGHHIFMEAAKTLLDEFPEAVFLSAGRGREGKTKRYAQMAGDFGLGDRFILLGFREDLPELIASMDLGVIASLGSEGSSRVALEYMASGIPLVATRVGGIPELLRQGELGALVDPNDPKALAEAIGAMLRDKAQRDFLASQGRKLVEDKHSHKRWIEDIEKVYEP